MGRRVKGWEEKRVGDLGGLFGVFGLDRPGGGPDEEAMPGAEAQQEIQLKLLLYRAIRTCIYTVYMLRTDQSVRYYIQ